MLISISWDLHEYIRAQVAKQEVWRKQVSYKKVIDRLMSIKGNFVVIRPKGDASINLLADKGKLYSSSVLVKQASKIADAQSRKFVIKYTRKDPKRFRICVGYALVQGHEVTYWIKSFWLYDKKERHIIEPSITPKLKYFGVTLSMLGTKTLSEKSRI
jgi:hypothetical protein